MRWRTRSESLELCNSPKTKQQNRTNWIIIQQVQNKGSKSSHIYTSIWAPMKSMKRWWSLWLNDLREFPSEDETESDEDDAEDWSKNEVSFIVNL